LVAWLLALLIWACGHNGGGTSSVPPRLERVSISVVNGWPGFNAEEYANEIATNQQGLVLIEGLPWFDRTTPCDVSHRQNCTEAYRFQRQNFLRAMAQRKIVTLITTQNSNSAGGWTMTDQQFKDYVRDIHEDAENVGMEWVWLGSPSEPWAHPPEEGRRRAQTARDVWPGIFVMPDAGAHIVTGRPYFDGIKFDHLEVHPCNYQEVGDALQHGPPTIIVTDCSPVLNPGPAQSSAWASQAVSKGIPLIIYDHFAVNPDIVGIRAVGAALGG
jgi:hypothetical protein